MAPKRFYPKADPKNCTNGRPVVMLILERPGPMTWCTKVVSWENPDGAARSLKELFYGSFGESKRKKVYLTNAVQWRPWGCDKGNPTPNRDLIRKESGRLKRQIAKMKPKHIVPLGNAALNALRFIYSDSDDLRRHRLIRDIGRSYKVGSAIVWPLVHPALRARHSRSFAKQKRDWAKFGKSVGSSL